MSGQQAVGNHVVGGKGGLGRHVGPAPGDATTPRGPRTVSPRFPPSPLPPRPPPPTSPGKSRGTMAGLAADGLTLRVGLLVGAAATECKRRAVGIYPLIVSVHTGYSQDELPRRAAFHPGPGVINEEKEEKEEKARRSTTRGTTDHKGHNGQQRTTTEHRENSFITSSPAPRNAPSRVQS